MSRGLPGGRCGGCGAVPALCDLFRLWAGAQIGWFHQAPRHSTGRRLEEETRLSCSIPVPFRCGGPLPDHLQSREADHLCENREDACKAVLFLCERNARRAAVCAQVLQGMQARGAPPTSRGAHAGDGIRASSRLAQRYNRKAELRERDTVFLCARLRHAALTCRCRPGPNRRRPGLHFDERAGSGPKPTLRQECAAVGSQATAVPEFDLAAPGKYATESALSRYWRASLMHQVFHLTPGARRRIAGGIPHQGNGLSPVRYCLVFLVAGHPGWLFALLFALRRLTLFGFRRRFFLAPDASCSSARRGPNWTRCGARLFGAQARRGRV